MDSDLRKEMLITAADGYLALLAAYAEVGRQVLEVGVADSKELAKTAALATRAPKENRQNAIEDVLVCVHDAHIRQMHMLRGASSLFGMSFLSHFEARNNRRSL